MVNPAPSERTRTFSDGPSPADDRLNELLAAWQTAHAAGQDIPAAELCRDQPDLLPAVEARLAALRPVAAPLTNPVLEETTATGEAAPAAPDASRISQIGSFKILGQLGQGGMGTVYRAEDAQLRRHVAVKVMRADLAANPTAHERFLREARAMAAVEHDSVAPIYFVGEDAGTPYLVMPLLKGEPLDARLHREPRPPLPEVLRIARETAEGLAAAHAVGLIHRDIKPSNVWLEGERARVRVLDFGLARAADGVSGWEDVTHSGATVGTPAYMAPEQATGGSIDHRADLFSLGVMFYQMATGSRPFTGPTAYAIITAVIQQDAPSPRHFAPHLPDAVSDLILELLAKDREQRPATARTVVERLAAIESDLTLPTEPSQDGIIWSGVAEGATVTLPPVRPRRRRARWIAAGGVIVVLAAVGVTLALGGRERDRRDTAAGIGSHHEPPTVPSAPAVPPAPTVPVAFPSPFDALDPAKLPDAAVHPWQPKELVAVLGNSTFRHWHRLGRDLHFSRDGKHLYASSQDGTITVRNATTGEIEKLYEHKLVNHGWSAPLALSPDGRWLVYGEDQNALVIREPSSGREVKRLTAHAKELKFTPDSKRLVGMSWDVTITVWSVETWEVERTFPILTKLDRDRFPSPQQHLPLFLLTPDGRSIAPLIRFRQPDENQLRVFSRDEGKIIQAIPLGKDFCNVAAFLPNGEELLYEGSNKNLYHRNLKTGETKQVQIPGAVYSIAVSPDGKFVIVGHFDSVSRIATDTLAVAWTRYLGYAGVGAPAIRPDGMVVACVNHNGDLVALDSRTGDRLPGSHQDRGVVQIHPLPRAGQFATISDREPNDSVWTIDAATGAARSDSVLTLPSSKSRAISRHGKMLAVAPRGEKRLALYDLESRTVLREFTWDFAIESVAYAPDGARLYLGRSDGEFVLIDPADGGIERSIGKQDTPIRQLAISPNGRIAATNGKAGTVHLWNLSTGQVQQTLSVDTRERSPELVLSPDGRRLVTTTNSWNFAWGFYDAQIKVWDIELGGPPITLVPPPGHAHGHAVAFSPDGRQIAVGTYSGTVDLWDAASGRFRRSIRIGPSLGVIMGVAYTPDGRHLLTSNGNETVAVLRTDLFPTSPDDNWIALDTNWIDLTALPDPNQDMEPAGSWVRQEKGWRADGLPDGKYSHLAFPVLAEGGYDLKLELTPRRGHEVAVVAVPIGSRHARFQINDPVGETATAEFLLAPGQPSAESTAKMTHPILPLGKKVVVMIEVRVSNGVADLKATLEGMGTAKWSGPVAELFVPEGAFQRAALVGISSRGASYTLHTAQFRRVDGIAKALRRKSP